MSFYFNTLFLLVAADGYSTAARCGLLKPLSLHPPTVHSRLYIVVFYLSIFSYLIAIKDLLYKFWMWGKVWIDKEMEKSAVQLNTLRRGKRWEKYLNTFRLEHEKYSSPEANLGFGVQIRSLYLLHVLQFKTNYVLKLPHLCKPTNKNAIMKVIQ